MIYCQAVSGHPPAEGRARLYQQILSLSDSLCNPEGGYLMTLRAIVCINSEQRAPGQYLWLYSGKQAKIWWFVKGNLCQRPSVEIYRPFKELVNSYLTHFCSDPWCTCVCESTVYKCAFIYM